MNNRKKNVVILIKIKTLIYFIQVITGIYGTQLVVDYLKKIESKKVMGPNWRSSLRTYLGHSAAAFHPLFPAVSLPLKYSPCQQFFSHRDFLPPGSLHLWYLAACILKPCSNSLKLVHEVSSARLRSVTREISQVHT
jgi:hypothetical protein